MCFMTLAKQIQIKLILSPSLSLLSSFSITLNPLHKEVSNLLEFLVGYMLGR